MAKNRDDNLNNENPDGDQNPENDPEFGLTRPTGELANTPSGDRPAADSRRPSDSGYSQHMTPEDLEKAAKGGAGQAWKGLEEDEEYESEVQFEREKNNDNEEMDMTPMVDVTFLLLIFFMVTASFTLQKSIEQPPSTTELPSTDTIDKPEDEDEYVEIIIDQYNTYRLTSRNIDEIEAPSDNEMRKRLKDMIDNTSAKRLIIKHHGDATHDKVITAWDAGVHNNIQNIITQLTEVDF